MKKRKLLMLLIPFLLSSCSKKDSGFDDGGMFGDDDDKPQFVIPELQNDSAINYQYDKSVGNKGGVNYEIFVRTFYDSDGDGIGDFNGVKEKLPYLKELGVSNIWLMPINPSPSYHGYDISDYYTVHSDFGTLEDFKNLIEEAKKLNIGIIMDLVINHCSTNNPYFTKSYRDYVNGNTSETSKADWFNWSEDSKTGYNKFNNEHLYYESRFSKSMPDFNLDNKEVREEIKNICKYWLDFGISGFRLDAVLYYYFGNDDQNIEFLNWLKDTCESIKPNTYIVGEAWNSTWNTLSPYYDSKIDSFFNFPSSIEGYQKEAIISCAKGINDSKDFAEAIERVENDIKAKNPNALSSYFLSNHDMDRSSKGLTGDVAKAAASLTYLLPGTPYIYYGEEIGLQGVRGQNDNSDAKRRLPMIWSETNKKGECDFPEKNRPDLDNTIQVKTGVEDNLNTNYSLVNHYKKVINLRNKYSFIRNSSFVNLTNRIEDPSKHVLAYKLVTDKESIIVIHNFNEKDIEIGLNNISNEIIDSINTTKKMPQIKEGKLGIGSYSTVILKA